MQHVVNRHTRDIAATPAAVGRLVDSLGGPADRLWPAESWPTTPFTLEGPPEVGTRGRQGQLTHEVAAYEPGRHLRLRYVEGQGLEGEHWFDVEPAPGGTRLTHTLDCRVPWWLRPAFPVFLRQHDALAEDLFDKAELETTGHVARPARWPRSVRIANAVELRALRAMERRGRSHAPAPPREPGGLDRAAALGVPLTLAGLSALHVAWALGWRWPGGNDEAFAERVIGYGAGVPPAAATWTVAGLLAASAVVVRASAKPDSAPLVQTAASGVAVVLFLRGGLSIPVDVVRGFDDVYERLDVTIYSPLCLFLAAGIRRVRGSASRPVPALS